MKKYNVCILGIRGAVGQEFYKILKQRNFPVNKLRLLSTSQVDEDIDGIPIETVNAHSFDDMDIGLFSPGAEISKIYDISRPSFYNYLKNRRRELAKSSVE